MWELSIKQTNRAVTQCFFLNPRSCQSREIKIFPLFFTVNSMMVLQFWPFWTSIATVDQQNLVNEMSKFVLTVRRTKHVLSAGFTSIQSWLELPAVSCARLPANTIHHSLCTHVKRESVSVLRDMCMGKAASVRCVEQETIPNNPYHCFASSNRVFSGLDAMSSRSRVKTGIPPTQHCPSDLTT